MTDVPRKRRWWRWVLGALLAIVILSALLGEDDQRPAPAASPIATTADTTTVSATTVPAAPSVATLVASRAAVDSGRYEAAIGLAAELGIDLREGLRLRIANRIARRALAALHRGDVGQARARLRQADRYPTTALTRRARTRYEAARSRATARARARRQAKARRVADAAAARAASQEAERQRAACDQSYEGACLNPDSADYDCAGGSGNGPDYTGTVRVVGDDHFDLDRDGDGTGCDP